MPRVRAPLAPAGSVLMGVVGLASGFGPPPLLTEPWAPLHGGRWAAAGKHPANPDPIGGYVWNLSDPALAGPNTSLQLITVVPERAAAFPAAAFSGIDALVGAGPQNGSNSTVAVGQGTLRLDFGAELAGWLELRSRDLTPAAVAAGCVAMSVGESTVPKFFSPSRLSPGVHNASNPAFAGWKTEVPVPYTDPQGSKAPFSRHQHHHRSRPHTVFRLELNAELYEGVRYGFLHINASCGVFAPFGIGSVVVRAQVKPANWLGVFSAAGRPVLERAWYVGGYTVKLSLGVDAIGSVLDQRGDRTPRGKMRGFAGDSHVAQATSLAVFGNFELVKSMQQQLAEFDSVYGTYLMYWVLSLADYHAATADGAAVIAMLPRAVEKMRRAYNRVMPKPPPPGTPPTKKADLQYAGWDERFNFAQLTPDGKYYPENGYVMMSLYVHASRTLAGLADAVGNTTIAAAYHTEATRMAAVVRSGAGGETPGDEWWRPLGLHASAHAANAGLINASEAPLVFASRFNDSGKVCSFSNFNQYFVLQGVANLGFPEHAMASIELCWGAELRLGATSFWEVGGYGGAWVAALAPSTDPAANASPPVPGHSSGADSKCHPWAAGATAWLTHNAAGLQPASCTRRGARPGWGVTGWPAVCVRVQPLLSAVVATLPTLHGAVSIAVDAAAGTHVLRLPPGIDLDGEAVLLPLAAGCTSVTSVAVNGLRVAPGTDGYTVSRAGRSTGAPANGTAAHCVALSAGLFGAAAEARTTRINVRCGRPDAPAISGAAEPATAPGALGLYPPPVWSVPLVGTDASTRGSWLGRFGSRGYKLFGLSAADGGARLDEPFIVGVGYTHGAETNRNTGSVANVPPADPRYPAALELPCPGTSAACTRGIGAVVTKSIDPMAIEATLALARLPAAQGGCVNISLYLVDWTGTDDPVHGAGAVAQRKIAIDVFTVAPGLEIDVGYATAVLGHPGLGHGEYRTWRACADRLRPNTTGVAMVRFRVYVVTGFNASVAAIFFD